MWWKRDKPLQADRTLLQHLDFILSEKLGNNNVHADPQDCTIRIRSVSTDVVHELTLRRVR